MIPPPIALALTLCEKIIVEEGTRKTTFVNAFTRLTVRQLPSPPLSVVVAAILTEGQGDATIELVVTALDTDEPIFSRRDQAHFSDRLGEARLVYRLEDLSFPRAGVYLFTLLVDGDWITHRRLRVIQGV
jgi:hypothetical protein